MVTWIITKTLRGGLLDGITVTEAMRADSALGAPFTAGQHVKGFASNYTVVSCELADAENIFKLSAKGITI